MKREYTEKDLQLLRDVAKMATPMGERDFGEMVDQLGPTMGFGRMMQIVSYKWRAWLEQQGYPPCGALVPALLSDKPEEERANYLAGYKNDPVFGDFTD